MIPRAPAGTRLAALVVNYESGAFAVRCVESLMRQWAAEGRDPGDLTVVVVDNASPSDQEPFLVQVEALGAEVIRSADNLGYAGGINACYARTEGGPRDVVAILNPDLYFLRGAVERLMGFVLADDAVGAVDPRCCIDPNLVINLPRNPLPTPLDLALHALARMSPWWARAYSKRRLREALPWWTSEEPLDARMLSGCCVFLRREVVDALPAPMDERFPLYYEDTDLFRQLERRGFRVVHLNEARMLHHWSRSVGMVGDPESPAMKRYFVAQRAYFDKYYGWWGRLVTALVNGVERRWPRKWQDRPMHAMVDLGPVEGPLRLPLPRACDYLVEIAATPTFLLAGGVVGSGDAWECPPETWDWLFAGTYFLRALDRGTGEVLGAWAVQKVSGGRLEPIRTEEADHVEELAAAAVG